MLLEMDIGHALKLQADKVHACKKYVQPVMDIFKEE